VEDAFDRDEIERVRIGVGAMADQFYDEAGW
jgi:hypothetical protein